MSNYIYSDDIKASIAIGFDLEPYLDESDGEIEDLAQRLGIMDTDDIKSDPLHYKVKRFAVVYVLTRLCQDKIGVNNPEVVEADKYVIMYGIYRKELEVLRSEVNYQMMTGNVLQSGDRASNTGYIFRS